MFTKFIEKFIDLLTNKLWHFFCTLWEKSKILAVFIICGCGLIFWGWQYIVQIPKYVPYITLSEGRDVSKLPENDVTLFNDLHKRLSKRVNIELNAMIENTKPRSAWALANIVSAVDVKDFTNDQIREIKKYFNDEITNNTSCWYQYKQKEADPICHIGGTAWVILALLNIGEPIPRGTIEFLINQQNKEEGWWGTYEGSNSIKENAGTYATSMAILALTEYRNKELLSPNTKTVVEDVINKATNWLVQSGDGGQCIWKDYPNRPTEAKEFRSLSGLSIYALNYAGYPGLSSINKTCLGVLSENLTTLDKIERSNIHLSLSGGLHRDDHVSHNVYMWVVSGVMATYYYGNILDKIKARYFISQSLFESSNEPDNTLLRHWQAGEATWFVRNIKTRGYF